MKSWDCRIWNTINTSITSLEEACWVETYKLRYLHVPLQKIKIKSNLPNLNLQQQTYSRRSPTFWAQLSNKRWWTVWNPSIATSMLKNSCRSLIFSRKCKSTSYRPRQPFRFTCISGDKGQKLKIRQIRANRQMMHQHLRGIHRKARYLEMRQHNRQYN